MPRPLCCLWAVLLLTLVLLPPALARADEADYDLPDGSGHFYRQANGQGGRGETGYTIRNADGIPFWDEYRRLGGPAALGYPASRRFVWDGFTVQVMQKAIFQWRPESQSVAFVNVLDRLHDTGHDGWLQVHRQTPAPFDTSPDTGLRWEEVTRRHWAFLETNPAIKNRYWADPAPVEHFGLPMSYADFGNVFVVRAQRAVFQYWKEDMPWAKQGEVTVANAGDIAKEVGVFPAVAVTPEAPSGLTQPIAPPCQSVPIRGFGTVWSSHPELFDFVGCPGWPAQEQAAEVVLQRFEHGWMLSVLIPPVAAPRAPTTPPQIYVLFEDNQTFAMFPDSWAAANDPVSTGLTPPPGRFEPQRGFGKVWREGTGVKTRERLGWATGPERAGQGAWQAFQRGRMVWTPDPRLVFVLAERTPRAEILNSWRVFEDTFTN